MKRRKKKAALARTGEHSPAPQAQSRWGRVAIIVFLLLIVTIAGYHIGLHLWTGYHRRAAESALARRDFVQARAHLDRCLQASPGDSSLLLLDARTARRIGDFGRAHRQLRLYEQNNGLADAVELERKLARLQRGNLEGADRLAAYCTEHPETPESFLVLEALIQGSLAALDFPRARKYLDLWLTHHTGPADQAQGLVWRGFMHRLDNAGQARADYQKAIELDPASKQARLGLVKLLVEDAPSEAAPHLTLLQERFPGDSDVLLQQALLYRNLGQLTEAAKVLDQVLEADPDHIDSLVERGKVALDLRQQEIAGRCLRRAAEQAPDRFEVLQALCRYLDQVGPPAEAKRYRERLQEAEARVKQRFQALSRDQSPSPPGKSSP